MTHKYVITAPHPASGAILTLREPELMDGERQESRVQIKRMMSGIPWTHVVEQPNDHHQWSFVLTRQKALEFLDFYRQYSASLWRVRRTRDASVVVGYVKVNPLTLEMIRRSAICHSNDAVVIEIEFESVDETAI